MMWRHMSGAGNTFIVADCRRLDLNLSSEEVKEFITDHPRPDGSVIEGMLTIDQTSSGLIVGSYFNPDGSRGMMCGNGARCLVRLAIDLDETIPSRDVQLVLNGATYGVQRIDRDTVSITFGPPRIIQRFETGTLDNVNVVVTYVDVNSDHVIINSLHDEDDPIVHTLRHHPTFPRGVNVNMVEPLNGEKTSTWRIATYERGVEGITGACGTGAIASAIALFVEGRTGTESNFVPPSGRPLHVSLLTTDTTILSAILTGDTRYDF